MRGRVIKGYATFRTSRIPQFNWRYDEKWTKKEKDKDYRCCAKKSFGQILALLGGFAIASNNIKGCPDGHETKENIHFKFTLSRAILIVKSNGPELKKEESKNKENRCLHFGFCVAGGWIGGLA